MLLPRLISFLVAVDGMHSGVSAGGSQHLWVQTEVCGWRSVRVTLDFDPASTLDSVVFQGFAGCKENQRKPKIQEMKTVFRHFLDLFGALAPGRAECVEVGAAPGDVSWAMWPWVL